MPDEILRGTGVMHDHKRVVTDDGRGLRIVEDGTTAVEYVVLLDVDRVRGMAVRAYRNKNGRSILGPVTVKIVKREKLGVKHGR